MHIWVWEDGIPKGVAAKDKATLDTDGTALDADEGWDVCHTLTAYTATTSIGMLAKGYGLDKANLKGWVKADSSKAAYLHGSFLKDDGKPTDTAGISNLLKIDLVKKFLEGLYPKVDFATVATSADAFQKSFDSNELVFGTAKLHKDTTDVSKAGVASLPTMLHTYLKLASNPKDTDITHLEQLIP